MARKYSEADREDILQAARVGAWQASQRFDPSRGVKFATMCVIRIRGAVLDEQRSMGRNGFGSMSLAIRRGERLRLQVFSAIEADQAQQTSRARTVDYSTQIPADEEPVGTGLEWHDDLDCLTRHLPPRQKQTLRLLYGHANCLRMHQVAKRLGVNESRVSQIHSQSLTILREQASQGGVA